MAVILEFCQQINHVPCAVNGSYFGALSTKQTMCREHHPNYLNTNKGFKTKHFSKAFLEKNIKGEKKEESLGFGKKSSGPETDTET